MMINTVVIPDLFKFIGDLPGGLTRGEIIIHNMDIAYSGLRCQSCNKKTPNPRSKVICTECRKKLDKKITRVG